MRKDALVLGAVAVTLACTHVPATNLPAPPPAAPAQAASAPPPAQPPAAVPAADLVDHAGESPDTAVTVPEDAPAGGVQFENEWIFDRFGRFRRQGGGTGTQTGRRYDIVKIELPNGERKTVFFDITENWNHWNPGS